MSINVYVDARNRATTLGLNVNGTIAATQRPRAPSPPVNIGRPQISGATAVGQTLTTSNGWWTSSPTSYVYQWRTCTSSGCTNISGATGSSYMLQSSDVSDTIDVVVTASNRGGSGSAVSVPTAAVTVTASTPNPAVLAQGLITSGGAVGGGSGGNGWGPQKLRIARSSDGDLFAVYPSGSDNNDKTYHLLRSTDNGATWADLDNGDGGRETPLLLIAPNNEVDLVIWNTGTAGVGGPRLVDDGVDGASRSSPTISNIPGSWTRNNNYPYSGAAVDSSGNLYVQENTASSLGGTTEDSGYIGNLAWTTGGTGNLTWHFTTLPVISGADFRYVYSFELPDNNGGVDIVATDGVACSNTSFTRNTAISNPAYTTQSTRSYGFMQDRVYDWHTPNLNASGGPTWAITEVSQNTRATGGSDCGSSGIIQNDYAQDAYRDTYGNVHIMYAFKPGYVGHHAVLGYSGGVWTILKDVTLPSGYCSNEARITQDYSGRFYILSNCASTSVYVWPADRTDGTTLGSLTTLPLPSPISGWDYFATPRGGTPTNQSYLDMVYPTNSSTGLAYARVQLATP